jgi:peptidyl-prolyl cis-trans isomerase B (cyclophilin B)
MRSLTGNKCSKPIESSQTSAMHQSTGRRSPSKVILRASGVESKNYSLDIILNKRLLLASATFGPSLLTCFLGALAAPGEKVFFDLKLEGQPAGRLVIELFSDVTVGASRFRDLAVGKEGVGYRLSRVDGIFDTHLRVAGVKQLSYSATGDSAIAGGDSVAELEAEMVSPSHLHDTSGLISLTVKEATERPIEEKLIAKGGKFVTIELQAGEAPNGTGFVITRGPAPNLDKTNLVVGRLVEGMELVEKIASLPFSKPRVEWYDGPFFEVGKVIGDKRAVVAEKGFNRPFKRVVISSSGILPM